MKILSEGKFRNFDGFKCMGSKKVSKLVFEDTEIRCTEDHKFLNDHGEWIEAKDITDIMSFSGQHILNRYECGEDKELVYDAINVENTHSFYTNGLTAHNCSMLYIDENAFVENWDDFAASVLPTLSSGKDSKLIFTSTPNGLNHFFHYCEGARKNKEGEVISNKSPGSNGFVYFEIPWFDVPGRDEIWKEKVLEDLNHNIQRFNVEYVCEFAGSSGTLIAGWKLKLLVATDPVESSQLGLKQWERYNNKSEYVILVDVSRGKGLDYSTCQVIKISTVPFVQVATFRSNEITPMDFAKVVYELGVMYGECGVLIEINDIGGQVADIVLQDLEYENIIMTESKGRSGKKISSGFGRSIDYGLRTTKTTKTVGCSQVKLLIEQDKLLLNDIDTINELNRFSSKKPGAPYEAESGCNDDLVMGLVLLGWLSNQEEFKDITDGNINEFLREKSDEEFMNELMPFGFIDNGVDHQEDNIIDIDGNIWTSM